jgi:ankyrin repeat protein
MRRYRYYFILLFSISILVGIGGWELLSPSHHRTEDYTPLFAAATGGDLATVREAVDKDRSLLRATEWDNATLLHDAVGQNHQDLATYLLDKGANVNAATKDGITALHMAAQNGNLDIMKLLLERGAKIDVVDSKGWTPTDRAVKWSHPDAGEFLRQRGGHEGTSAR